MSDVINMTNKDLLLEIDRHIGGCSLSDCSICPRTIAVMKELASRIGVENFVPSLERRRRKY